jgi:hypothetical protein
MHFTDQMQEIVGNAYLLSLDGRGMVLEDHALPDAERLCEAGWLEQRVEPDGEPSWWWTPMAETALDLGALMTSAESQQN